MKVFDKKTGGKGELKTVLLILVAFFLIRGVVNGQTIQGIPSNNADVHRWAKQHFAKGKVPPFSFFYGGKSSNSFIKSWQFSAEKLKSTEPNAEETIYTWSDKQGGLAVKCTVTCFDDFQAVEWVLNFVNISGKNTPLVEQVAAIDYSFVSGSEGHFILHHAKGSNAERSDFQPIDDHMEIGKSIYMTPVGGRSSDNTAFPFFNIEMPNGQGIMVAVGWTGKWYADVRQADEKSVSLKSGMEKMKLAALSERRNTHTQNLPSFLERGRPHDWA